MVLTYWNCYMRASAVMNFVGTGNQNDYVQKRDILLNKVHLYLIWVSFCVYFYHEIDITFAII